MSNPLDRLTAALADRYAIEEELGAGGMATVYLATDLKHDRKVAVKVLRPELSAILGGERFLNEIKVTANLQHPNILPLYDSGEADTFLYYVMPYIEGETLRDKLNREKQLGVEETVEIAKLVAGALSFAHARGVIHRDIKPDNILLQSGQALVADFGIALAVRQAGGTRLTETGLSLGTPHYMSPEQATGDRELDARSDVYSLGAMVYEMLVGNPPHIGSSAQAIIAKILSEKPSPITQSRDLVPANVDATIQKALAKSPADRFTTAAQFVEALTNPAFALPTVHGTTAARAASGAHWSRMAVLGWSLTAVLAVWGWMRATVSSPTESRPVKLSYVLPQDQVGGRDVAISPDATYLAWVAAQRDTMRLFLRPLDQLDARPIAGTEGATAPFFSPNGQWVGFFADGSLKKVPSEGGGVQTIAEDVPQGNASWGKDGTILVAAVQTGGLASVSEFGGVLQPVSTLEPGERLHTMPHFLPNGRSALFTVATGMNTDATRIEVLSLETGARQVVAENGYDARYASSGHVVYAGGSSLFALEFDVKRLQATGAPVRVLEDVRLGPEQHELDFGFSTNGVLAYVPAPAVPTGTLLWVDRQGDASEIVSTAGQFFTLSLSPDGDRLAVTRTVGAHGPGSLGRERGVLPRFETWTLELDRIALSRFAFDGDNHVPIWTPDGERIVFTSNRELSADLFWKPLDGAASAELLYASPGHKDAGSWSPDGRLMAFAEVSPETGWDIWVLFADSTPRARPLLQSRFAESRPMISPNGRWLAYSSNESGRLEVNVIPFPDGGRKLQISIGGGAAPVWARDGLEVFYRTGDSVMAVGVGGIAEFEIGRPQLLFRRPYDRGGGFGSPAYDVDPDGQRFLMTKTEQPADETTQFNLVLNWFEELKQRVGN